MTVLSVGFLKSVMKPGRCGVDLTTTSPVGKRKTISDGKLSRANTEKKSRGESSRRQLFTPGQPFVGW
jgi:hypothetical protein